MRLYYVAGACSMAPHIALLETGIAFELQKVDHRKRRTQDGEDYTRINPKGHVPALELDDGEILSEASAILLYVADQAPDTSLAPPPATMPRYHLIDWLSFIATEIHKQFAPMFNPDTLSEWKNHQRRLLTKRFDYLRGQLTDRPYIMGETFTVADAYLFTVLYWTFLFDMDLRPWPALEDYLARIGTRASVMEAMKVEGLT